MTRRPRRNHSPAFKAKVAVAAIKGEKTLIAQIAIFANDTSHPINSLIPQSSFWI